MSELEVMLLSALRDPTNPVLRHILADWLEEHGDDASLLRQEGVWLLQWDKGLSAQRAGWGAMSDAKGHILWLGKSLLVLACQQMMDRIGRLESSPEGCVLLAWTHDGDRWLCRHCLEEEGKKVATLLALLKAGRLTLNELRAVP